MSLPPHIQLHDKVILFDGVCKLCNAWSDFIIKNDKKHHFKLCSVQSEEGKEILTYFKFPTDYFETMLYVEGNHFYQKSDAFFKILSTLGMPWSLLYIFKVFPRKLRNWVYDRIALNRYKLFGKYNFCRLPEPDHEGRYVREK
jgi:predicted DCC family thiol-disulfide oxidoreductase YuxK